MNASGDAWEFEYEMEVRDYELDVQGVVNNAVYQQYLEHARHQYLKWKGLDFVKLHDEGTDAVVHKVELTYKRSLVDSNRFKVKIWAEQKGYVRFVFHQNIYRIPDNELILEGLVTAVFMHKGKAIKPPEHVIEALRRK
jgi:acyl-CoA thioester hydrolase